MNIIVAALLFILLMAIAALVGAGVYFVAEWCSCPETIARILTVIAVVLTLLSGIYAYSSGAFAGSRFL